MRQRIRCFFGKHPTVVLREDGETFDPATHEDLYYQAYQCTQCQRYSFEYWSLSEQKV